MNEEQRRLKTYDATLRAFLSLAKAAGWKTSEEQVESLLVCLCQLVEDGGLPADTFERLFDILEEMARAERRS